MLTRRNFLKGALSAALLAAVPAAQATPGFAYNFHSAPEPAAAKGYNRRVFYDDFDTLNTIDTTNSKVDGFNWYLDNNWPEATRTDFQTERPATNPAFINVQDSILTLSSTNIGGGFTLYGAASRPNEKGYVGHVFDPRGGFYVEFELAIDLVAANNILGWPAVWGLGIEMLLGNTNGFIEPDFFEAFHHDPAHPTFAVHDWIDTNDNSVVIQSSLGIDSGFHRYGCRVTPTSANNGAGLIERFFDGVHVPSLDVVYSLGGGATPAAKPRNPNGVFSLIEQQPFFLILGTGLNWPLMIDWIAIWAPMPSSPPENQAS